MIYAARRQFKVSRTLIGKTVIVLHDDHVFHLIDNHGTVIDTHTDPPPDRYIPRTTPSDQQET